MSLKTKFKSVVCIVVLLLTGCTGGMGDMDGAEKKEIKEKAIQHIKEKYQKDYEVTEIDKNPATGQSYMIRGNIKDEQNTQVTVFIELPNEIRDTYVSKSWTEELSPKINSLIQKHFDVRKIKHINYSNGTQKDKYTGDIPSVFNVLENGGDPDFALTITLEIYEKNGQYEQEIQSFLKELKGLNFNEIGVAVFVYEDKLKTAPEGTNDSDYLLYRYNIYFKDIQKVDIDQHDLDQYKTVIKH